MKLFYLEGAGMAHAIVLAEDEAGAINHVYHKTRLGMEKDPYVLRTFFGYGDIVTEVQELEFPDRYRIR